jgi:sec-independent protein translocase protein TatB
MFGIDSSELALIALVALLVIGPKDLPKALRWLGQWVGKARAMSRHVRTGFDAMMREAELEEMQKMWAAQNEAIMKATAITDYTLPQLPDPLANDDWMGTAEPPALPPAPAAEAPAEAAPPKKPRKPRTSKSLAKKPAAPDPADPA